jgi:hypothetical protein
MEPMQLGAVPRKSIVVGPEAGEGFVAYAETTLSPLLYSSSWPGDAADRAHLMCARCGHMGVSLRHVDVMVASDYQVSRTLRVLPYSGEVIPDITPPAELRVQDLPRESTIGLLFECQLNHQFLVEFGMHKAETRATVSSWDTEPEAVQG